MTTIIVDGPNLLIRLIATLDVASQSLQERLLEFLYWNGEKCHALVFAWEGEDSTKSRRKIIEEYKQNRGRNREDDQFFFQQAQQLLEDLNIGQIAVPGIEADDVIAYLTRKIPDQVKIISEDRDFYQLLTNKRVRLNRPRSKFVYDYNNLVEKEGVLAENYLVARAIIGDNSDNLKGLTSIGLKRLSHYFPVLGEREIGLDELATIETTDNFARKLQKKLIEERDLVEKNLRVMTLDTGSLSQSSQSKIEYQLSNRTSKTMSIMEFKQLLGRHSVRYDPSRLSKLYFLFQRLAKSKIVVSQ